MILMFTPMSIKEPVHPRVGTNKKILEKHGYKIYIYNLNKNSFLNKINYLALSFFNLVAFCRSISYLLKYKEKVKIIYITDMQYLPIAMLAKLFNKKVLYETLDNNVELHFYSLSKKIAFIKKYIFLKKIFSKIEKKLVNLFVDEVIVNSKALAEYFYPIKTNIIYYTSPFENLNNFKNGEVEGIYLGLFTKDKGAKEILDFIQKYNLKLNLFGDIKESDIKKRVNLLAKKNQIKIFKRMSPKMLETYLKELLKYKRLIGFSLIKNVHYSYETQEANKDIDYLAMGIPIIGNERKPTKEKVLKGCGVFINEEEKVLKVLKNYDYYCNLSNNAKNLYKELYSNEIYKIKFLNIIEKLIENA